MKSLLPTKIHEADGRDLEVTIKEADENDH
jgi:hypothetical protein